MEVNGVWDVIFFDPPEITEPVALVRSYVRLEEALPLEDLTWEGTADLDWQVIDYPQNPAILYPNVGQELEYFIETDETEAAVLVRYSVAWANDPTREHIAHFVNEAILESHSPQAIIGWLSNFDVHNVYDEPIDNFELEFYGNIEPGDINRIYASGGTPWLQPAGWKDFGPPWGMHWIGPTWYGGWGTPVEINVIPAPAGQKGVEIIWKDPHHPVQPCEWTHFGVGINLQRKVEVIPAPPQFWSEFFGGVRDLIIWDPPEVTEGVAVVREYATINKDTPLPYVDDSGNQLSYVPLEFLMWEEMDALGLDWTLHDTAGPVVIPPNGVAEMEIPTTEDDTAVLVRYTSGWESDPDNTIVRYVNEAILETASPQAITGVLGNFDVINTYPEPVDNLEMDFFGDLNDPNSLILPGDILWWFPGWGTPPQVAYLGVTSFPPYVTTEVKWKDRNNPIATGQVEHFGLSYTPGLVPIGVKVYWTQLVWLSGAKAYLTQIINRPPVAVCKDITVSLDASGNVSITPSDVDGGSYDPDGDPIALSIDKSNFTCADVGDNTVTLTVTDSCFGATDTCHATVTVVDDMPPTIACNTYDITKKDAPVSFTATATDNCPPVTITVSGLRCYRIKKDGTEKPKKCKHVSVSGATVTIAKAPSPCTYIEWTVTATDPSGNTVTKVCRVHVVKRVPGDDDDDDDG
jgi:hypothetical protein